MFDKLIEFLIKLGKDVLLWVVIEEWNEAVLLRFGKFVKVLKPGIHFKIPFFDSVWETETITQSIDMNPQSITTADGKNIVVKAIIRFSVVDTKTYVMSIMKPHDVLVDTTQGMIREIIEDTRWYDLVGIDKQLTTEVGKFMRRWGIKVEKVTLTDLAEIPSYRVIMNKEEKQPVIVPENLN
jgi:regulator of protease activity HflC (stomatin/prohibitin superfamily)